MPQPARAAELWRPLPRCAPECVAGEPGRAGLPRRLARTVSGAVLMVLALLLPRFPSWLARALLGAIGVRLRATGAAIRPGALMVGNHVSWLDIVVMQALNRPVRAVAKAEVGQWPVIGRVGRARGMILVDRSRPRRLPDTVAEVARALRAGDTVQVFPEGTTTCGQEHAAPWRAAFLQAAIDAGAPVQVFELTYNHRAAAFVGDESLLQALGRVLRLRGLAVSIEIHEPQPAYGDRRALARRLSGVVDRDRPVRSVTRSRFTESIQLVHSEAGGCGG